MLKKEQSPDSVDEMIAAIDKLLDDILKTCVNVSREWGDENKIATVTIDHALDIASGNTAKMQGKYIVNLRTNIMLMLGGLKSLCNEKAVEMGTKFVPRVVFVEYIRVIKNQVRKGANKPELPPVFQSK